jgi:hypothetical protein
VALAVGAERRASHSASMALQDGALFSSLRIPQPRRLVPRRRHHALAVGAERRASHMAMALQDGDLFFPVSTSHSRAVSS